MTSLPPYKVCTPDLLLCSETVTVARCCSCGHPVGAMQHKQQQPGRNVPAATHSNARSSNVAASAAATTTITCT
eukprot:CAMPEP_0172835226 /NCGR_PEP_ID=MMETSP1075-20121228/25599_1 /TAXON_ID=2916 /ORGANISM="Ceratium fusus, Strain PA161109" /LENGTH=73 /DNA_ID=CAMNT_0013678237 /DNA_START=401 /DNA_END=619 /DNA_ORIENTATION=-